MKWYVAHQVCANEFQTVLVLLCYVSNSNGKVNKPNFGEQANSIGFWKELIETASEVLKRVQR